MKRQEVRRPGIRVPPLQRLSNALPPDIGANKREFLPTVAREDVRRLIPCELVDVVTVRRREILGCVIRPAAFHRELCRREQRSECGRRLHGTGGRPDRGRRCLCSFSGLRRSERAGWILRRTSRYRMIEVERRNV